MKRTREEKIAAASSDHHVDDDHDDHDNIDSISDEEISEPNGKRTVRRTSNSYLILGEEFHNRGEHAKGFDCFCKGYEIHKSSELEHAIGCCYTFGLGVEKDYSKAREWYLKAAEKGFANSK